MSKSDWPPHFVHGPHSTAHPYPLEIAFHATIFLTGAIFNDAFLDAAIGDYFQQVPDFYERVHAMFIARGLSESSWDNNWKAFQAYRETFPNPILQNTVFSMVIHWDWYIAKLGGFVQFALNELGQKVQNKELPRIAFKKIDDQLRILGESTGLAFPLGSGVTELLIEMDLVRNLGMHNQWKTDAYYCKLAMRRDWASNVVRVVTMPEIEKWHDALTDTIRLTSNEVAKTYVAVGPYSP